MSDDKVRNAPVYLHLTREEAECLHVLAGEGAGQILSDGDAAFATIGGKRRQNAALRSVRKLGEAIARHEQKWSAR